MDDSDCLLDWRNDRATREASYNTKPISLIEHVSWLKSTLSNSNRKLYMAEIDGEPVGTVRADFENPGYELSWTVAPARRGLGIGTEMVRLLARLITDTIRAEIKAGNVASIKIAESAGMTREKEIDGVVYYRRVTNQ